MPAALGSSVGSSCSSFGSQGQLQNSAVDLMAAGLQQQQQLQQLQGHAASHAAAAAAASPKSSQISPFALNQPAAAAAAGSSEGGAESAAAEAAAAASSSNVEVDTVPPSAASLNRIKGYQAKKQLFRGDARELGEHSLSMLLGSSSRGSMAEPGAGSAAAGDLTRIAGQQASDLSRPSMADDTAAAGDDPHAAAFRAGSGAAAAAAGGSALASSNSYAHWSRQESTLDMLSPDLLAALQHMSAGFDPAAGTLQNSSCNAAAITALQHQQLLAAVASSQALQQQQQQLLGAQFSAPLSSADAESVDGWAMQLASMRARDARASDSQVLLGASGQRGDVMTSFRLSSPSLPGCYNGAAAYGSPGTAEAAAAAAAQAWQQAAMSHNQQEQQHMQQQRDSFSNLATAKATAATAASMPASQAFRDKHKQQLQLQLPEFDLVSAPLTSAQLTAGTPFDQTFDQRFDQLITTEVMPDTPATAALQSPLNVQAAMLAATSNSATASSALYGNSSSNFGGSSGDGSNWVDWNSMAALLSPMHVPGLATRRFTDCFVPASTDHAGLLMQQEQQRLRQQHSRSAAGVNAPVYGRHSTSFLGTEPTLPGLASLSEQQAAHAAAAAATSSSIEMFGLPSAPARYGDASGAFGRTRQGSLCLDAHPQLPSFSMGHQQQQQLGTSEAGSASNSSNANARFDSDAANAQAGNSSSGSNAANCQLKRVHLSDAGAAGGLYSSGSFTFKPPVLQQLMRESRLGSTGSGSSSGSSSSSDAMITEPFQMPSFFRSSQQSGGGSSGGGSSSGSGGGSTGSPTKAAAAAGTAAVGVSAMLPRVSENGALHQQQVQPAADSGISGLHADGASQAAQLEPSDSQKQQEQPDAAAAAAGPEGGNSPLNAQLQQQQPAVGGFDDVYRSLFGNEGAPTS
jgi:hypothetical protein